MSACFQGPEEPRALEAPAPDGGPRDEPDDSDAGPLPAEPDAAPEDAPHSALRLLQAPSGTAWTPTVRFAFGCGDAPCATRCRVDDDDFAACQSPFDTRPVAPGAHRFEVATEGVDGGLETVAHDFRVQFPYTIVHHDRPLGVLDGYVQADFRCTRLDMAWQGEAVFDAVRPDPFKCPIEYWLVSLDQPGEERWFEGSGIEYLGTGFRPGEFELRMRIRPPKDDPAGWPEGTLAEVTQAVARDATPPVDTGDGDAMRPADATGPSFVIRKPLIGDNCPGAAVSGVFGQPDFIGATVYTAMTASQPASADQTSTSCTITIPVRVASGWNVARAVATFQGSISGGAAIRFRAELDGKELLATSIDPAAGEPLVFPFDTFNWSGCVEERELTVRVDLDDLIANGAETVRASLASFDLSLAAQGTFGWQTCGR